MDQEKIGKFIKEIRKKNNLTQKDLADKYNVTYQAVSKWENGKNMPDTSLIKEMSKDFNISLDDFFEGEYSTKSRKKKTIYIISCTLIIIILIIVGAIYLFKRGDNNFEFKILKSNCSNFDISGSISYNNSKSAIYISEVSYCGANDNEEYSDIKCTLYESSNDANKIIDTCNYDKNTKITLEDFLKDVSFTVDNYQKVCETYSKDSLYLEIEAKNEDEEIITYKIPLMLESDCD